MICEKPFRRGVEEFGCGRCVPCRMSYRRLWTTRIMLERAQHEESCFVTLTYRDEDYPVKINREVMLDELQKWLKRLRYYATKFRYFVVAERGSQTKRLHYHALLFGISFPDHENPRKNFQCSCRLCASWPLGGAYVGDVEEKSVAYVLSYVIDGTKSEVALRSLKPGLGACGAEAISDFVLGKEGSAVLASVGDVPAFVRRERQMRSIGRYLRGKVRESVGMEGGEPECTRVRRLSVLQNSLRSYEERMKAEGKRLSGVAKAKYRASIARTKKGVGV